MHFRHRNREQFIGNCLYQQLKSAAVASWQLACLNLCDNNFMSVCIPNMVNPTSTFVWFTMNPFRCRVRLGSYVHIEN